MYTGVASPLFLFPNSIIDIVSSCQGFQLVLIVSSLLLFVEVVNRLMDKLNALSLCRFKLTLILAHQNSE
jgi:hypothetical protein